MDTTNLTQKPFEILVVDDDAVMCLLHRKNLESCNINHRIVQCINGKQAMAHLESRKGSETNFLILLDLNMPVMDGWEFLEKCKEKSYSSRVSVVVLTSSVYKPDITRALAFRQVIAFCDKPLTTETVQEIRKLEEISHFFEPSEGAAVRGRKDEKDKSDSPI